MMPAKAKNRTRLERRPLTHLAPHLDKGLRGYATAAAAAGVGLFALVQPAEAKIVFTPSNIPITFAGGQLQFDVNHDGIPDFALSWSCVNNFCFTSMGGRRHPSDINEFELAVIPTQASNQVNAITSAINSTRGILCAKELGKGHTIGFGKHFQGGKIPLYEMFSVGSPAYCQWRGKTNHGGFLGLKFVVGGQTYYGWAHVSLTPTGPSLTGYAYEDVAGQPILTGATRGADEASVSNPPVLLAPQPAGLGILALGAPGLALWRRPEEMN
jgi:hypothetical protein